MDAKEVKDCLFSLGAELCGIASLDRFEAAPKGHHPLDVLPTCRSVISFACRFPAAALRCTSNSPYTRIRNSITDKMNAIALDFCIAMEKRGIGCVPIPANESEWDAESGRRRSIVSQKHAAAAAGLGTIGRHSLLITPELGSMVWLGCVLSEAELPPDTIKPSICNQCGLCVDICPIHALESEQMNQTACWDYAFGTNEGTQTWEISCHRCRDVCPFHLGTENSF